MLARGRPSEIGPCPCQAPAGCPCFPAMTDATSILPTDRGLIGVTGADGRPFLQGIVTNDVEAVGD